MGIVSWGRGCQRAQICSLTIRQNLTLGVLHPLLRMLHIEQSLWLTGRAACLWYQPVSIANLWQLTRSFVRGIGCLFGI